MSEGHGEHGQPEKGSGAAQPPAQGYPPAPGYPPYPGPPQGGGWPPAPPPYPGYGPAPSAPQGYGAPPHLERPTAVRAGLGAYIAGLILSLIALAYEALNFSAILDAAKASLNEQQSQAVSRLGPDFEHTVLVLSLTVGLVVLVLEALFVWWAWQGRNWARIVLWVLAGLVVVFGVVNLAGSSYLPGFIHGLNICQWVLNLAAIVFLLQRPANEWYRYRKWQRATGQG
jgi:hypothetical protein